MANKLKVGLLKEEEVKNSEDKEPIAAFVVDREAKWFCSETIDGQLHDELIKSGIFGPESFHVVVDGELAKTPGVQVVGEQTANKLDSIIRSHLQELCSETAFEKPLSESALKVLRRISALVKAFDCVKYEIQLPEKWHKIITMEL